MVSQTMPFSWFSLYSSQGWQVVMLGTQSKFACPMQTSLRRPWGPGRSVVEFAVAARLGHGQRARAALLERRRSARPERAGDAGIAPTYVARGARSGLLPRHGVRIAGAMTIAPAHQVNM